jgi:hypothetical protein
VHIRISYRLSAFFEISWRSTFKGLIVGSGT